MVVATRSSRRIHLPCLSSCQRKRPLQSKQHQLPERRIVLRGDKQATNQLRDDAEKLNEPAIKPKDDDKELFKEAGGAQKLEKDDEQVRETEAEAAQKLQHHEESKKQQPPQRRLVLRGDKQATNQLRDDAEKLKEPALKLEDDKELLIEDEDAQKLEKDDDKLRETEAEAAQKLQRHEEGKSQEKQLYQCAAVSPYEAFRLQRIAENRARMAALGVDKHAATLTSFFKVTKARTPSQNKRRSPSTVSCPDLLRRSERLRHVPAPPPGFYTDGSNASNGKLSYQNRQNVHNLADLKVSTELSEHEKNRKRSKNEAEFGKQTYRNHQDFDNVRPANAPIPKNCPADLKISSELSAYRCKSKERGTLYDTIVGICCHFCRQKKLCGEEMCQRCGERDVTKPCRGKTDCSKCHSARGVFCRACLKIRYGEEMDEVWPRDDWLCPHCTEEQGFNRYWICNSSICLTRRKIAPTGIAIYKARELGFKSVAHYLADFLEKRTG